MVGGEEHHILIVDDDRRIRQLLASYLSQNAYRVTQAGNAKEARNAMDGLSFDAVVLDVMMPGESGLSLAKTLRDAGNVVPLLMLSALGEAQDRINGLAAGSDDYLVKPFAPEELLLRLHNLLKRNQAAVPSVKSVRFGECHFDVENGELMRRGERIHLTNREKEILRVLASARGAPVARNVLQPPGVQEAARAIDVQVTRLRQKIEDDPAAPRHLQTIRGLGYCLYAESVE
jgi:two-component system, OmpR family, phosphate regulon response regulator OmpR